MFAMDLVALNGAVEGVRYLKDLTKVILGEKIEMSVRERILELMRGVDDVYEKLFQARDDAFRLQQQNFELMKKLQSFEDWKQTEQQYVIKETPGGARLNLSLNPNTMSVQLVLEKKSRF